MEEGDKEGVVFSKGINFKDLMGGGAEFHIDVNFKDGKQKSDPFLMDDDDLFKDDDTSEDSDSEEVIRNIEKSAEENLLASPQYKTFSELASKMVDCISTGEVKILIIEEGDTLVPEDAEVLIHYAAYWEKDDIPFDCTLTKNLATPVSFRLGTGQMIPGLEIGLTTVKGPTARFQLLIEPAAAWGPRGVPPRIRAAPVLFIVTLLQVKDIGAIERFNDLPVAEQKKFDVTIKTVTAANAHAKDSFKKGLYHKAVRRYHKTLSVLQMSCPETEQQMEEIRKLLSNVYINLAVCYAKLKMPNKVLLMCDDFGRISNIETHCKGLYYYGKAFVMLGQYEEAKKYYKRALKLEPKNTEIGKAMADLDDIIKQSAKNERRIWRKAFENESKDIDESENVDEEFKKNLKETCEELDGRQEYVKFDLPSGLMKKDVDYIKKVVKAFDRLSVLEVDEGSKKKISIVKQIF